MGYFMIFPYISIYIYIHTYIHRETPWSNICPFKVVDMPCIVYLTYRNYGSGWNAFFGGCLLHNDAGMDPATFSGV